MRIYRLEDWQGDGPWTTKGRADVPARFGKWYWACSANPAWWADSVLWQTLIERYDDILYGCCPHTYLVTGLTSLSQIRQWFPKGALGALRKAGYNLVAYEVPESAIHHGEHQVVFDRRKARHITRAKDRRNQMAIRARLNRCDDALRVNGAA